MRRILTLSAAATALFAAVAFAPAGAPAMPIAADGGGTAVGGAPTAQAAVYRCRPVWQCGDRGCRWRRACWWEPGPSWRDSYGDGPYRPYRQWGPWGWHHRYW